MFKLSMSYFGHIMKRQDSLERTIMLAKEAGKEEDQISDELTP